MHYSTGIPALVVAIAIAGTAAPAARALSFDVKITSDNGYAFGWGDINGIHDPAKFHGSIINVLTNQIQNGDQVYDPAPGVLIQSGAIERYRVEDVDPDDYLYILAWSDDGAFQGTIGSFETDDGTTLTGSGWEVFATGYEMGVDFRYQDLATGEVGYTTGSPAPYNYYNLSLGPNPSYTILGGIEIGDPDAPAGAHPSVLTADDLPLVNDFVGHANSATGGIDTSVGWVDEDGGAGLVGTLAVHTKRGTFGIPGSMGAESRWMWYNPDPSVYTTPGLVMDPQESKYPGAFKEFLIFRHRAGDIAGLDFDPPTDPPTDVPEPATLSLLALGVTRMRG